MENDGYPAQQTARSLSVLLSVGACLWVMLLENAALGIAIRRFRRKFASNPAELCDVCVSDQCVADVA